MPQFVGIQLLLLILLGFLILLQSWGFGMDGYADLGLQSMRLGTMILFTGLWVYAALYLFVKTLSPQTASRILEMGGIGAFIFYIGYVYQQPLFAGMPSCGDHITHVTLAKLTEVNLRTFHQLFGWCSAIGQGIPLNEQYPPGGNLLLFALRALTFWSVSMERIYALTTLAAYLGFAGLIYAVVRREFGRLAALVSLVFMGLDSGQSFLGLNHSLEGGMWASQLGVALSLWAFSLCARPGSFSSRWQALGVALALGTGMVLHPFTLFVTVLWVVLLILFQFIFQRGKETEKIWTFPKWFIVGLGFGLSAFYQLPFTLSGEWVYPYGFWGMFLPEPGREILYGQLFRESPMVYTLTGMLAIALGLFCRRPFFFVLSIFCGINIFLAVDAARTFSTLGFSHHFFNQMQVFRLVCVAKLGGVILASGMLGLFILRSWTSRRLPYWIAKAGQWLFAPSGGWSQQGMKSGLGVFCLLFWMTAAATPFLSLGGQAVSAFWKQYIYPLPNMIYATPDYPAFWEPILDAVSQIPKEDTVGEVAQFFTNPLPDSRLGLIMGPWRPVYASVYRAMPVYGHGYMPAILMRTRIQGLEDWKLDLCHVKYLLDIKGPDKPMPEGMQGLSVFYQNEQIRVFQRESWTASGWILHGTGEVQRQPLDDLGLRFSIQNAEGPALLRIGVSNYRKWKAFMNGTPVSTYSLPVQGEPVDSELLLGIPVENGTLEIVYQDAWFDIAGWVVSGVAAFLLFLLIATPAWRWLAQRTFLWNAGMRRGMTFLLDGSAVVLTLLLLAMGLMGSPNTNTAGYIYLLGHNFADHVGLQEHRANGVKDICFMLEFTREKGHGAIQSIQVMAKGSTPDDPLDVRWRTSREAAYKLAVEDPLGNRLDRDDGSLVLPSSKRLQLLLLANPVDIHRHPSTMRYTCQVQYADGTVMTY
jgi:hypothetical protein